MTGSANIRTRLPDPPLLVVTDRRQAERSLADILDAAFAAADAVFLASWVLQVGPLPPGCVPVGLAYPVLAAAGSAALERAFPLTGWNTEPDLWRHPRKYLPLAVALFAVLAVRAVGSLVA